MGSREGVGLGPQECPRFGTAAEASDADQGQVC